MDTFQIGPLQIILALVALAALAALVQTARRWQIVDSLFLLVVFAVCLITMYASVAIQSYGGLTNDIKVDHIRASAIANTSVPTLSVEVTTYDQQGHATSDKAYLVRGNEWELQANIIKFAPMFGMLGLHSGYKLTRLEGRYDSPALEANGKHTVAVLNGGDDGFFTTAHSLEGFIAPFIDATYGNAVFDGPGSFDVYLSQSGLWAKGV